MLQEYIKVTWRAMLALLYLLIITGCLGGGGGDSIPPPPEDTTPPVTTADPASGFYNTVQSVTLTANEAATIYYSTDGNDPAVGGGNTASGDSPITGISIPEGTTILKFFAVDLTGNNEAIKAETYVVNLSAPVVTFTSGAPSPIGLLSQTTVTWQSSEDGSYIIELGGNGTPGSGTQIASGTVQANNPVNQVITGKQLTYMAATEIWVYVTDALGATGTDYESLSLKPFVTIPSVTPVHVDTPLLINNAGTRLYVLGNPVKVIDLVAGSGDYNTVVASIPAGASSVGMAITPDDARLYVTHEQSSSISVIDTATNTVATTITSGLLNLPHGIAITPDGTRAYITHWGTTVNVLNIDPASVGYHTIIDNIIINSYLLWGEIAITPDGKKAVVNWRGMIGGGVDVLDVDPASPSYNIPVAQPVPLMGGTANDVVVSSDNKYAYVNVGAFNGFKKIDLSDYSIPVEVNDYIIGFSLTPDDQLLLGGRSGSDGIVIIEAADLSVSATVPVGGSILDVTVTADGHNSYVTRYDSNTSSYELLMLPLQ